MLCVVVYTPAQFKSWGNENISAPWTTGDKDPCLCMHFPHISVLIKHDYADGQLGEPGKIRDMK